jgi:hypothetical protein
MIESMELANKIDILLMNTKRETAFAALQIAIAVVTEQQAKAVSFETVERLQ